LRKHYAHDGFLINLRFASISFMTRLLRQWVWARFIGAIMPVCAVANKLAFWVETLRARPDEAGAVLNGALRI
jgi:hypothetical protein